MNFKITNNEQFDWRYTDTKSENAVFYMVPVYSQRPVELSKGIYYFLLDSII